MAARTLLTRRAVPLIRSRGRLTAFAGRLRQQLARTIAKAAGTAQRSTQTRIAGRVITLIDTALKEDALVLRQDLAEVSRQTAGAGRPTGVRGANRPVALIGAGAECFDTDVLRKHNARAVR